MSQRGCGLREWLRFVIRSCEGPTLRLRSGGLPRTKGVREVASGSNGKRKSRKSRDALFAQFH